MLNKSNLLPKIAVVVAFLFLAFIFIKDRSDFSQIIANANYRYFPFIVFFSLGAIGLSALGYYFVAGLFGIKIPFLKLYPVAVFTIIVNNLMAFGGAAGFTLRIFMLKKYQIQAKRVLASSFFHMYLYTIGITAFIPFSLMYIFSGFTLPQKQHETLFFAAVGSSAIFIIVTLIMFVKPFRRGVLFFIGKIIKKFLGKDIKNSLENFDFVVSEGIKAAANNLLFMPLLFIITIADYSSSSLAFYYCFKSLGVKIGHLDVFSGLVLASSAGILSMIPGGIGIQETSGAEVFKIMGVPFETAFLSSLLFRVFFFIAPFAVAVIFFLRYKFEIREGE